MKIMVNNQVIEIEIISDLFKIAKFPEYANELFIQPALQDPEEFKELFSCNRALCYTAQQVPQCADVLIEHVLKNPDEFKRLISCYYELRDTINAIRKFPEYADKLIQCANEWLIQPALLNPEGSIEFITSVMDLCHTATLIPQCADALIKHILKNSDEFERLIKNYYGLNEAKKVFPKYADELTQRAIELLIQPALLNPEKFKRLIPNCGVLRDTKKAFPTYADKLTQCANEWLIQPALLNPEKFEKLIEVDPNLCAIAKQVPQCSDALIQYVLKKPKRFKRFIDKSNLSTMAKQFHNCNILQKQSLAEVIRALKDSTEIGKNSRVLAVLKNKPSFFASLPLPDPLNIQIAALTGNPDIHNEAEAIKIAKDAYHSSPQI
jgi:hypothetical protein